MLAPVYFIPVPRALSAKNIQGYSESQSATKAAFHAGAKKFLKALASQLGVPAGEYRLDTNNGGPAVCGETTLHTDSLYVQISEGSMGSKVMYRTCTSRKDYTGGINCFEEINRLSDSFAQGRLIERMRAMAPVKPAAAMSTAVDDVNAAILSAGAGPAPARRPAP